MHQNQAIPSATPTTDHNGHQLIIVASGLHKTYRTGVLTIQALRGVDFVVSRGEMVAIMGPSGCGKTTLLNCLSGLDTFDSGDVRIAGTALRDMNDNQKTAYRATNMGFVFQVYNLLPVLSAVENVELPLLVSGIRAREARQRALAALERVHLDAWATHRPAELSGGQRQRVTIARALVSAPAIVWADEPTGALDSESAADIMDLLGQVNATGQTVVMVTHAPEVGERAHRIVRMRDGRIETSFVAVLGTGLGLVLGGLVGKQYVASQTSSNPDAQLMIPWGQVLLIVVIVYAASFTSKPSVNVAHPYVAMRFAG